MDELPTLLEAFEQFDDARRDREDTLLAWSRAKQQRLITYRDALLSSQQSTVTGQRHDAEIATTDTDVLLVELESSLKVYEGRIHYASTLIAALTSPDQ
jgi:hypothetical protein